MSAFRGEADMAKLCVRALAIFQRNDPSVPHLDGHCTPLLWRRSGMLNLQLRRVGGVRLHGQQRRGAVIGGTGDAAADARAVRHDRQILGAKAERAPLAARPAPLQTPQWLF